MLAAPPPTAPPSGKSLFSQHYLDTRLPDHLEWTEDPQAAFDAVRDLWQAEIRIVEESTKYRYGEV